MSHKDTIAAIHVSPGSEVSRCLETARGRTVLERVAAMAADTPRVAAVAVLTPTSGQAMSLGRSFKNRIPAGFFSFRGGRVAATCKWLLQQHHADFILSLDGGALLYSRTILRHITDASAAQNRPFVFDPAAHSPALQSVFGCVCAAPAHHVRKAAALRETASCAPALRLQAMLALAGGKPSLFTPGPDALQELFKLNFDNRLFSCASLAVQLVDPAVNRTIPGKQPAPECFMDATLFESVCRELAGLERTFTLVLAHGGDPLLHPEIFSLIRIAAAHGLGTELHTNGLLLNDERTQAACESGLNTLVANIDAVDDDTYFDSHRMPLAPVENNVQRLLNIRTHSSSGLRVAVRFTLDHANRREAARFFEKWQPLADRVIFSEARDELGKIQNRERLNTAVERHACERPMRRPLLTLKGDVLMCPVAGAGKFLNCGSIHERGVVGALTHTGARTMFTKKPAAWRGKPCIACDLWRFDSFAENITAKTIASFQQPIQGEFNK
jgi:pyruvate-formate lyase-activating enzyme